MGLLGKVAFWRKSGRKATPVEAFEVPPNRVEVRKAKPMDPSFHRKEPCDASGSPASTSEAGRHHEAEACRDGNESLPLASPHSGVTIESVPSPVRQTPMGEQQVGVAAVAADPPVAGFDLSADEFLESELVDEVLQPLPGPKVTLEQNCPLGRAISPGDQEVCFDVSVEELYAGVSQAFGAMIGSSLQSPKWDKRAQALKAVGTMLRGLDLQGMAPPGSTGVLGKGLRLRDRVCCWRSCCQLLHHVMRDKVMPVRLASHELFHEAFANAEGLVSQEECHRALNVLIKHVIEKLGDSNLRLHESARKCVYFCAERPGLLGLDATLALLRERLGSCGRGGERQKVHNGVLDAVNFLLNHFPGRRNERIQDIEDDDEGADNAVAPMGSWTQHDIAPFIAAGMDDSLGPRVRSTVIILAVTVYQTFGMEAMQPVLDGLRPAKQALLRQKFQESEDMDPEEFARSTGCGTTSSTMATPSERVSRSEEYPDLVVCGSKFKLGGAQPALPGALEDAEEEELMDGILEETGMVFGGTCIINEGFGHDSRCLRPVPGLTSRSVLEDDLEEEHRILEEELLMLDMDLRDIDEQEALFGDCTRAGPTAEIPIEVC